MDLEHCDTYEFDEKRREEPVTQPEPPPPPHLSQRYRGDITNFYAHRAVRLPGNGTAILEAQDPDPLSGRKWREVNTLNRKPGLGLLCSLTPSCRYWTSDAADRGVDPYKKIKRDNERKERKMLKEKLRQDYERMGYPGIPKDVVTDQRVCVGRSNVFPGDSGEEKGLHCLYASQVEER
eukprot:756649-Hanusia_phi.AAC.3